MISLFSELCHNLLNLTNFPYLFYCNYRRSAPTHCFHQPAMVVNYLFGEIRSPSPSTVHAKGQTLPNHQTYIYMSAQRLLNNKMQQWLHLLSFLESMKLLSSPHYRFSMKYSFKYWAKAWCRCLGETN